MYERKKIHRVCCRELLAVPESWPWRELMRKDAVDLGIRLVLHPGLLEPLTALIAEVTEDLAARTTRVFCWGCHAEVRLDAGRCSGCGQVLVS